MKKKSFVIMLLGIMLACIAWPLLAMADDGLSLGQITDYLTPEEFASFAGQVTFVVLVVQFLKLPIDHVVGKVKTEYIVYAVAVIAQVLGQAMLYGLSGFTWSFVPKCIAFAFLVAVSAKEVYVKAIGNVEAKKAAKLEQTVVKPPEAA